MEDPAISDFKKHVSELLWRHLGNFHAQQYINVEEILIEIEAYADGSSQGILQELRQRSISAEQLAMETIILLTRGKLRLGVLNDSQGRLNQAGVILSNMIDNISIEGKQKGYLSASSGSNSSGCLGMIIVPTILGVSLLYGFIRMLGIS